MKKNVIKTKAEARSKAIDWQHWVSEQNLSYSELAEWTAYFIDIAKRFNLVGEFKENGLI